MERVSRSHRRRWRGVRELVSVPRLFVGRDGMNRFLFIDERSLHSWDAQRVVVGGVVLELVSVLQSFIGREPNE